MADAMEITGIDNTNLEDPAPHVEASIVPSDSGGSLDKSITPPLPPIKMKRLTPLEKINWKQGDPIPQGYQARSGVLTEIRKNSEVPPDYPPELWRALSGDMKKKAKKEYQDKLEAEKARGNKSPADAPATIAAHSDDDSEKSFTSASCDSECSTEAPPWKVVCATGNHLCSGYSAAPCHLCFQMCCNKHTDGYHGARKCVK